MSLDCGIKLVYSIDMVLIRFTLRIFPKLNTFLINDALKHNRSKHQHIVHILETYQRVQEGRPDIRDEVWFALKGKSQ